MYNYITEFLKYNQCENLIGSAVTHEVCSCHLTLYAVCCIAFTSIENCLLFWHTAAVDRTDCFRCKEKCPDYSLVFGNIRSLWTCDKTREFHSKFILPQGVSVYVNMRTALNVALTNTDWEGFSISHFLFFILYLIYLLLF
jgi:hypothetical protein